jgi:hypothetical protein
MHASGITKLIIQMTERRIPKCSAIYGLIHSFPPEDAYANVLRDCGYFEVRYVGQTTRSLRQRLTEHCRHSQSKHQPALHSWLKSLDGTRPAIIELERKPTDLDVAEKKWIAELKEAGHRLTNLTVGGNGFSGPHPAEVRQRIGDAARGRPKTPKTRALLSEVMRERKTTPEQIRRLRELAFAMRGTTQSAEQKAKSGAAVSKARNPLGPQGVSWDSYHQQYRARPALNGQQIHLGYFDTPEEADEAIKARVKECGLIDCVRVPRRGAVQG